MMSVIRLDRRNHAERIYCMIMMAFGGACYGFVIGTVTSLVTQVRPRPGPGPARPCRRLRRRRAARTDGTCMPRARSAGRREPARVLLQDGGGARVHDGEELPAQAVYSRAGERATAAPAGLACMWRAMAARCTLCMTTQRYYKLLLSHKTSLDQHAILSSLST